MTENRTSIPVITLTSEREVSGKVINLVAGAPTAAGRIYGRKVLQRAVQDVQERVTGGKLFGGLSRSLREWQSGCAAHVITSMKWSPGGANMIQCTARILDTGAGRFLGELIMAGLPLSLAARGTMTNFHGHETITIRFVDVVTEEVAGGMFPLIVGPDNQCKEIKQFVHIRKLRIPGRSQ